VSFLNKHFKVSLAIDKYKFSLREIIHVLTVFNAIKVNESDIFIDLMVSKMVHL